MWRGWFQIPPELTMVLMSLFLTTITRKEIHLYLDTDEAGRKAVNKLMFSLDDVKIVDMSNIYNGKKDLNEVLCSE